jgi:T5orf172 domain
MADKVEAFDIAGRLVQLLEWAEAIGITLSPLDNGDGGECEYAITWSGERHTEGVRVVKGERWTTVYDGELPYLDGPLPWELRTASRRPELVKAKPGTVYYGRRGDQIKIGTTTDMKMRMTQLRFDEILAWEPGTYDVERQRHEQFGHLRVGRGEWFRAEDELTAHCGALRATHGDPDPKWPAFKR